MKKMMFNDRFGLTEAVLQDRKTVTRRIVCKPNYNEVFDNSVCQFNKGWIDYIELIGCKRAYSYKAPYKVGEIVAVAQSYNTIEERLGRNYVPSRYPSNGIARRNKMFVLADAMPYQIRILNIGAERLQDITEEDYLRDTPEVQNMINKHYEQVERLGGRVDDNLITPRNAYAHIIDKISGKGTWDSNPFVWRIEFELIK